MLTLEEVMRIAKESGSNLHFNLGGFDGGTYNDLLTFARQVEAETIAKVLSLTPSYEGKDSGFIYGYRSAINDYRDAIRALSSPIEQIAAEPKPCDCEERWGLTKGGPPCKATVPKGHLCLVCMHESACHEVATPGTNAGEHECAWAPAGDGRFVCSFIGCNNSTTEAEIIANLQRSRA